MTRRKAGTPELSRPTRKEKTPCAEQSPVPMLGVLVAARNWRSFLFGQFKGVDLAAVILPDDPGLRIIRNHPCRRSWPSTLEQACNQ